MAQRSSQRDRFAEMVVTLIDVVSLRLPHNGCHLQLEPFFWDWENDQYLFIIVIVCYSHSTIILGVIEYYSYFLTPFIVYTCKKMVVGISRAFHEPCTKLLQISTHHCEGPDQRFGARKNVYGESRPWTQWQPWGKKHIPWSLISQLNQVKLLNWNELDIFWIHETIHQTIQKWFSG